MLKHPRPGMCCRKTPPTGLSNQRSVKPHFVDTVEEHFRLIEILHEPGISLTQRLPAHLQWQHIGAVLWLISFSTFSSIKVTRCSGGVSEASRGSAPTGIFACLPRNRRPS